MARSRLYSNTLAAKITTVLYLVIDSIWPPRFSEFRSGKLTEYGCV